MNPSLDRYNYRGGFLNTGDRGATLFGLKAQRDHEQSQTDHTHIHHREFDEHPVIYPNPSDRLHVDYGTPTTVLRPKLDFVEFQRNGFKRFNRDHQLSVAFARKPSERAFNIAAAMGHKGSGGLYGNLRNEDLNPELGGGLIVDAEPFELKEVCMAHNDFRPQ